MLDLIFIGAITGFFLATLAYVRGCERLRGKGNEYCINHWFISNCFVTDLFGLRAA